MRIVSNMRVARDALPLNTEESQWLAQHHTLTIGVVSNEMVPFDIIGLSNEYEGISADYLGAIAAMLGVTLQVRTFLTVEQASEALAANEVDLLPSIPTQWWGSGRLTNPYIPARLVQVTTPGKHLNPQAEVTVGYVRGHAMSQILQRAFPHARLQPYASTFLGLSAAGSGSIDVFVDYGASAAYLIDQYQLLSLRPVELEAPDMQFHFAVGTDNAMLARLIDRALAALPVRARSEVKARWTPNYDPSDVSSNVSLSEAERQWIATHRVVHYAAVHDRMPFIFLDAAGHLGGLSIELLDLIADKTGLIFRPVDQGQADTASIDMQPVAIRDMTPESGMVVTDGYFRGYWVVVSRVTSADHIRLEDLAGKRIAYLPPNGVVEQIKERIPSVQLHPVKSISDSYKLVVSGDADVTVGNINTANYFVRYYGDLLKVAGGISEAPVDIAFGVRSDKPELVNIINRTLETLSPEDMWRMRSHWMHVRPSDIDWARYYPWFFGGAGGLLACFALFLLWNRSLQRQIYLRKRSEDKLRDELAFRNAMVDAIPQAIAVRDRDLRLVTCNAMMEHLYGLRRDELFGRSVSERPLPGKTKAQSNETEQRYRAVLEKGAPISLDIDLVVAGVPAKLSHWVSPVVLQAGDPPVALISGLTDVTPRQRLLEMVEAARTEAEMASRAKSNFLATMSHEIRSPMNAVLGVLELLQCKTRLDEGDRTSIELAYSSAASLLRLLDDILDISKIEAGGLEITAHTARLGPLVEEVVAVFASLARQRGLRISVFIDPAISAWHHVDSLRFRQIVNNLVSNAIKYTDAGEVRVNLRRSGGDANCETVVLEVEDTGIGMGPDELANLSIPFYQAEAAGPRTEGGTGLGWPIVHRLCCLMNGEVIVDSEPGKGTCARITLTLPLSEPPTQDSPSTADVPALAEAGPQWGKFKVLVVDDHLANRIVLQCQLAHLGFRCEQAQNGEIALQIWREGGIDLVLTDCTMPVMDGYQLTAAIRAEERLSGAIRCPILGCTAHTQEDRLNLALQVGMDECLTKPLEVAQLLAALARHLSSDVIPAPELPVPSSNAVVPPAFDLRLLQAFFGGANDAEVHFLEVLHQTNTSDLVTLQNFIGSASLAEASACCHRIKGAARLIGAAQVCGDCEALADAIRRDEADAIAGAADAIATSVERLNLAITTHLSSYR
ncbi:ATP-binding protein [Pseudomonas sp. OV226]|uniref:ATP-binding protein n=1 Tax=Pseudomonas sp. OV226 TaxID=2135588 RepID=UPI001304EF2A|nr:transporter substrate-binding domain-containing protein [Pseudomonas sp. OV226]